MTKDANLVVMALSYWINHIVTGDHVISKQDFLDMGKPEDDLPKLVPTQKELVNKLENLRGRIINEGYINVDLQE